MSNDGSNKSSNSHSESSSSSPNQNQPYFHLDGKDSMSDLSSSTFFRSGTVRRVSAGSKKDVEVEKEEQEEQEKSPDAIVPERYRKSLDSTYRHSLESIHEYKTYSTSSLVQNSSSDLQDFAQIDNDKTIMSQSSSYLSWIESVNSEYFGSGAPSNDFNDCDNKVGEWNNFWLNYNSARSKYLSSTYLYSQEDKEKDKVEDFSEVKSTCSTQRDLTDKGSSECVTLTLEEVNEALRCVQKVVDILQIASRRADHDFEDTNNSFYSQSFTRQSSSIKEVDVATVVTRERSFSYAVDAQDLQKQKLLMKNTPQSSSTSCINALLNTGVADMLKRVITKRKDGASTEDGRGSFSGSFPDWSSAK